MGEVGERTDKCKTTCTCTYIPAYMKYTSLGSGGGGIDNLAASFCTLNQNILKTPEMKSLLSELNR